MDMTASAAAHAGVFAAFMMQEINMCKSKLMNARITVDKRRSSVCFV